MADTISLTLTGPGSDPIEGDHSETTLERENTIEVLSLTQPQRTAFERATGLATGRRFYEPITFTKRIDRASPKLRQALAQNQVVSGSFRWFRPNPVGGSTQHFFTIEFTNGRIVSVEARLMNTLDPALAGLPPLEEVKLVFNTITWTFEEPGIMFVDTWSATT